jgi:hypothetical protein
MIPGMILGRQPWRAFYNAARQLESGKFKHEDVSRETDPKSSPSTLFHVKQIGRRNELND